MIISKLKYIYNFKKNNEDNFVLYANYLLILYAFFLPINNSPTRIIFSLILILFLLSGNIKEKLIFAIKDKVVQAFILFYLLHVIWIIGSEHVDIALNKMQEFRYIFYIIIYISIIRKDFIYKILTGFILGIFFSEIVSYLMLMDIRLPYLPYTGTGVNVPFMSSFTQYSTVLSISMGILLYGIITIKQKWYLKLLYILFFISASSNIFIIQSKLGYGLYSISILTVAFLIIVKYKRYWMLPVASVLIFGGYLIAYNLSNVFHQRVNGFFNETKAAVEVQNYHTSTGTRVGFNKYGYELVQENILFGLGTGDHIAGFLEYVRDEETNKANYKSFYECTSNGAAGSLHSEFLDNSLQFGIVGFLVFLNIFYQLVRYPYQDHYMKVIQVIFIVILLAVSSVSLIFLYSKIGKIFTLLSALTLTLYYEKNKIKKI